MADNASPETVAAMLREARKARQEIQAHLDQPFRSPLRDRLLKWPEPYEPPQIALESFTVVVAGLPYTFVTKQAAREMRDLLNGMTLEGEL